MIDYKAGFWGLGLVCQIQGSVFPKVFCISIPNALLAVLLHHVFGPSAGVLDEVDALDGHTNDSTMMDGVGSIWAGYTFVLGFLVVFRNNQAYTRFWEGAT